MCSRCRPVDMCSRCIRLRRLQFSLQLVHAAYSVLVLDDLTHLPAPPSLHSRQNPSLQVTRIVGLDRPKLRPSLTSLDPGQWILLGLSFHPSERAPQFSRKSDLHNRSTVGLSTM
ncbi:hypothetical protein K466DRAFT_248959 [Polyporus arcularius HHB13444]|uniref:Uncharacterized protein n=1 Tax=Polyporus arcularius HHB13444 TaxID=1314778 RepID=A0A5C3P2F8_9APHY|nr:hypothetical protein K466DRAFT_248959 [Polyporus arcularius HHB13444]